MAEVLPQLLSGFTRNLDAAEIWTLQDDLGRSVTAFQGIAAEERRERIVRLARAADPAPLAQDEDVLGRMCLGGCAWEDVLGSHARHKHGCARVAPNGEIKANKRNNYLSGPRRMRRARVSVGGEANLRGFFHAPIKYARHDR